MFPVSGAAQFIASDAMWQVPITSAKCAYCSMSIADAAKTLGELELNERDAIIAEQVLKEINARLGFLLDVGLDYLSMSRNAATLAGGEAQRIRLASQIGAGLVGVMYILDEPSIGLHQRDNTRLLNIPGLPFRFGASPASAGASPAILAPQPQRSLRLAHLGVAALPVHLRVSQLRALPRLRLVHARATRSRGPTKPLRVSRSMDIHRGVV